MKFPCCPSLLHFTKLHAHFVFCVGVFAEIEVLAFLVETSAQAEKRPRCIRASACSRVSPFSSSSVSMKSVRYWRPIMPRSVESTRFTSVNTLKSCAHAVITEAIRRARDNSVRFILLLFRVVLGIVPEVFFDAGYVVVEWGVFHESRAYSANGVVLLAGAGREFVGNAEAVGGLCERL